jgi:hypothetical protein
LVKIKLCRDPDLDRAKKPGSGSRFKESILAKTKPYPALLIQEVENAQLGLDEVNAGLVVVEVDHLPLDPLLQQQQHVNNDDDKDPYEEKGSAASAAATS